MFSFLQIKVPVMIMKAKNVWIVEYDISLLEKTEKIHKEH